MFEGRNNESYARQEDLFPKGEHFYCFAFSRAIPLLLTMHIVAVAAAIIAVTSAVFLFVATATAAVLVLSSFLSLLLCVSFLMLLFINRELLKPRRSRTTHQKALKSNTPRTARKKETIYLKNVAKCY